MITDYLKAREKALEEAFFARENERLKDAVLHDVRTHDARRALACASGIDDEVVLQHMLDQALTPLTVAALALVPLVVVAWADGHVDAPERAAVLDAAREASGLRPTDAAYALLESWLQARPPPRLATLWREYAEALFATLDSSAKKVLRNALIERMQRVADASGGIFGFGRHTSRAEHSVLEQLRTVMH